MIAYMFGFDFKMTRFNHNFYSTLFRKSNVIYLFVTLIALLYSIIISNAAVFQSDWAAYILFLKEIITFNSFTGYYMPPTPALFQVTAYVLPFYLIFDISYKSFYFPILVQTFVNVLAFYYLLTKIFPYKLGIKKLIPLFVLCLTLTGPLLSIIDASMFRKDIPLILLAIYFLLSVQNYSLKILKRNYLTKIFLAITFLSIQAYGDPFVIYMFLLPLLATSFFYYLFNSKSTIKVFSISIYVFICILFSSFLRIITSKYLLNLYS